MTGAGASVAASTTPTPAPVFPGGTSVTRLSVYENTAPDGIAGGTPHLHTASTEGYVVVGGSGALQTIDPSGFRETPLEPGSVVWFTPGTLHRAVNHGGLEVLVVMSNAGLPEAGDAVMAFPEHVVADPEEYARRAALPGPGASEAELAAAATARRDLGVEGFTALRAAVEAGSFDALDRFYEHAAAIVAPRADSWRELWTASVVRAADETDAALTALGSASAATLAAASVATVQPSDGFKRFGMCGRLRTYDVREPSVLAGARGASVPAPATDPTPAPATPLGS